SAATERSRSLPFTTQTSVTYAGTAHGLGTPNLFVQVFDTAGQLLDAQGRGHPTASDVGVGFLQPQTRRLVVLGARPTAAPLAHSGTRFTNATSVSVPASSHGHGTTNLEVQVRDASTPAQIFTAPLTIDAAGTVTATFLQPMSGRLLVGGQTAAGALT